MRNTYTLSMFRKELKGSIDEAQAQALQKFFRTGKGQYGEGDIFLGIKVPAQREIAKKYIHLDMDDVHKLLSSRIHEERFCALFILRKKFENAMSPNQRKIIFDFYIENSPRIDNWDLVDLSAPNIVGEYLLDKDRKILYDFAKSDNLWQKRIAVLATFTFIRKNDFQDTLSVAEILLEDKHDLIHKAVGWMLREVGKRDSRTEERFLDKHYKTMPRTMLRYAIEKFDKEKKERYMGRQ